MRGSALSPTQLLARVHAAVRAAQARAWARRADIQAASAFSLPGLAEWQVERGRWTPWITVGHIAFEGTVSRRGMPLMITPGRSRWAWLMRKRAHWIEVRCDASEDWAPWLYIDGIPVETNGE